MKNKSKDFKKELELATKNATVLVSNQDTIRSMEEKGEKIERKFITYKAYLEDLFTRKRKVALQLVTPIPKMRDNLGSAILQSIYEEMRDSLALGIFSSAIMHPILLLEYAMRIRVYKERQKADPNAKWEPVAGLLIRPLANALHKSVVINKEQKADLIGFNEKIRNPYMHINIYELTKGMTLDVTSVNIIKEEVERIEKSPVTENPHMWFVGKKKYDAMSVLPIMKKCVNYVNIISV
jgi:hypothetical protein